ncbi:hypothetical protein MKY64_02545 [Paenibacillus sp. FSL R7-0210]|uniref:hypothetical protein n=1 Tax=Paenibacillus sp. FSL R7-0210 TaxID=2921676 RepID=UPI0030F56C0D
MRLTWGNGGTEAGLPARRSMADGLAVAFTARRIMGGSWALLLHWASELVITDFM